MKINDLLNIIDKKVMSDEYSNSDLVQIIEQCGSYLNLRTISYYAKEAGMSYNGAKKHRKNVTIFNTKFIIDNL
jgi:hypothetical protein